MNNLFSNLGVTDPSNLSLSNQIALQQLNIEKAQEKAQQTTEASNIVGAEFIKGGLEKIGKGAAAKTGFSSLGNLGKNIKSKGFTAGLTQTIEDAKKEAIAKGRAFGQKQIDEITNRAKATLSKNDLGKFVDADKYVAGRKNMLSSINQNLQNKGLPTVDPEDITSSPQDLLKQIQDKIKAKQSIKALTEEDIPDIDAVPKIRFAGQDYSVGKTLNESRLAQVQAKRASDIATEENLITGRSIEIKKPVLPDLNDLSVVDGLPDEEERVRDLVQKNFFKDLDAGRKPIVPESLGGPKKKLVQDAPPATAEPPPPPPPPPAQAEPPQPKVISEPKKLPSTLQEADYLTPPEATPADASPERVQTDQSKLVDIDNNLDSRLSQLSPSDQAKIKAGYGADFERNVGQLPVGQARNTALANNINIKKQALKENAPELLDDTVYENSSREAFLEASKAKTKILRSSVKNLSPNKQKVWQDAVKSHPEYTNTADMKDLRANDFDAYRKARNTNQDIRENAFNDVNIAPEPEFAQPVAPTVAPTVEPIVEPTVEPTAEPKVKPTVEPSVDPQANTIATDTKGTAATGLGEDTDDILKDVAGGAEDIIGGLFEGGLGAVAMLLPSLFESSDSTSQPIKAPPAISQTGTSGQGR